MPKSILIAEDERLTREVLTNLAIAHGYEVVAVKDGIDLLTMSSLERFDAIITDLIMMDLDGASATEIMKLHGNTAPVIALTALSPMETSNLQDKFTKIYHKSGDYNELFDYLKSVIGK